MDCVRPYYLDGPVNQLMYLDMLQNWFVPQRDKPSIKNDVSFEKDGSLTHYTLAVREYAREVFSDCYFAVGHLCCPLHLYGHLNAQIRHCVIIQLWRYLKVLLYSSATKYLKTFNKQRVLFLNVSLHKYSGKYLAEFDADL
jgi:hypothetical protein